MKRGDKSGGSVTLREKQSLHVCLVAKLIEYATQRGYELTWGEAWRTPEQAVLNARTGKGIRNSLHGDRLAVDLNLFRDGVFLSSSDAHRPLGEYWETLHSLARWGGRFGDGNHYSIEHEGRK
jgi:hypothetical protein